MKKISEMGKEEILELSPEVLQSISSREDIITIAKKLGCYWHFDYEKSKSGIIGYHAILKSGSHSDEFFNIRELLEYPNVRRFIARQMYQSYLDLSEPMPDFIAGIPDGATKLSEDLALLMGAEAAKLSKKEGKIFFETKLSTGDIVLFVEDVMTRGTATRESVASMRENNFSSYYLPFLMVVVNRSGSELFKISGERKEMEVISQVECKPREWDPEKVCPLCDLGSKALKPKAPPENWNFFQEGSFCLIV